MRMPMVHVRIVRMGVEKRLMHVKVGVGFMAVPAVVRVTVVFVVNVRVRMLEVLVKVLMRVGFAHMQPHSPRHQCTGDDQLPRYRIA
jgi:hypothetical protein